MIRILILFLTYSGFAYSNPLDVPEHIWNDLSSENQIQLSQKFDIRIHNKISYGTLVNSQVLDKSSRGTNAGASLGSAYAQSRYIDNAFSGNSIDYSATKQLGAGLLGAVVGSLIDKPSESKFITRYTVQLANNEIQTFDQTSSEVEFTSNAGLCVLTNPVRPANQSLCNMTKRELLLTDVTSLTKNEQNSLQINSPISNKVKCKIGNNAPTLINKNLCLSANGEIL